MATLTIRNLDDRARFAALGDVQLPIDAREPVRPTPEVHESPVAKRASKKASIRQHR